MTSAVDDSARGQPDDQRRLPAETGQREDDSGKREAADDDLKRAESENVTPERPQPRGRSSGR